jgi:periplasmic protein TonB
MFEDSTFESQGRIHTRSSNWMLATLLFNGTILLTLILMPLIYPSTLPNQWRNILITTPPAPQQTAPQSAARTSSQTVSMPRPILMPVTNAPTQIHIGRASTDGPASAVDNNPVGDLSNSGNGIPGGDPFSHTANSTPRVVRPTGTLTISRGVADGMLIWKVVPVYPAIGRAVRIEGTVVLQATISKTGMIENLRVIDGPAMLRQAALDAVKQWRYRPYLLNGDPVEVETTINVNFTLGR